MLYKMAQCQRCKKVFNTQWELVRHMKRMNPCKVVENVVKPPRSNPNNTSGNPNNTSGNPNNTSGNPNNTSSNPNNTSGNPNDTSSNPNEPQERSMQKNQCEYCLKIFSTGSNYNKHLKRCKLKDCEIRKKELRVNKLNTEEKIEFVPPPPNTCRFCKTCFTQACSLTRHLKTCKEKEIYKEQLDVKYEQLVQNIEQLINNNDHSVNDNSVNDNSTNITNNITINAIGKESLDHIQLQKVIDMIVKHKAEGDFDCTKSVYLVAGNMIADYQKMIREKPENRNVVVSNEGRQTAMIKRGEKFELEEVNAALDDAFRNTSSHFYDKMSEIEENQRKPFKKGTKEIHDKVKVLKEKGFAPGKLKDEDKVRRRFKVANMEIKSDL